MAVPMTTTFDHANPAHRTVKGWRYADLNKAWRTNARAYAATHGEAKVWRADDSVVRFLAEERQDGTVMVHQKTYRSVVHQNL